MRAQKEAARSTAKLSAPEKTDTRILAVTPTAINSEQEDVATLISEAMKSALLSIYKLLGGAQ